MALRPAERRDRGFTLLETVLALTVFGFAIIVVAGFLDAQMSAARRLEARADLVRAAETVLESVRGGLLPLVAGAVDLGDEFAAPSGRRIFIRLAVGDGPAGGLYEVSVRAWTHLPGSDQSVELTSMVWRP